ncbi:MAG: hypothetical protein R6V58_13910 [Planctomycetota bacterium]
MTAALRRWTGSDEPVLEEGPASQGRFLEYLLHDWRPDGGTGPTVVERFAETAAEDLSREERRQLDHWLHRRRRGLFEIEDASPREHLTTFRDRLTGETVQVFDVSLARQATRGILLIGAVHPCGDRMEMTGFPSQVPRHIRTQFEAWLHRERAAWRERRGLSDGAATWPRFFSEQAAEIERAATRIADTPPRFVLSTGETMAPGHALYEVDERARVRTALLESLGLAERGPGKGNEIDGDSFGWPRETEGDRLPFEKPVPDTDDEGRRVLMIQSSYVEPEDQHRSGVPRQEDIATVYLGDDRMEVSAMSKERLDFVCEAVENELGAAIRLVRRQESTADMIDRLWEQRSEPRGRRRWTKPKDPGLLQLEQEMGDRLWRDWIDSPSKALGGKSPRDAAADPELRPELEAILRDFEEQQRRGHGAGGPWTGQFARNVRRELGME